MSISNTATVSEKSKTSSKIVDIDPKKDWVKIDKATNK